MSRSPGPLRRLLLVASGALIAGACTSVREQTLDDLRAVRDVIEVAHRGGADLAPENTMAAFRIALEYHAEAVELDVHLSADDELVVIHDRRLSRTTDGNGDVHDHRLEILRTFDASQGRNGGLVGPQHIPTLDEVLTLVGDAAAIHVEIKTGARRTRYAGIEQQVVEALRRYEVIDSAVVLSFTPEILTTVREIEPRLATCLLIGPRYLVAVGRDETRERRAAELAADGVSYVGVPKRWLTPRLYASFRNANLGVGVWTVNRTATMRRFAAIGVDFITSDRPDLLQVVFPD